MGLFITFIFMFSGLAYASVLAGVPPVPPADDIVVNDVSADEDATAELVSSEETTEKVNS